MIDISSDARGICSSCAGRPTATTAPWLAVRARAPAYAAFAPVITMVVKACSNFAVLSVLLKASSAPAFFASCNLSSAMSTSLKLAKASALDLANHTCVYSIAHCLCIHDCNVAYLVSDVNLFATRSLLTNSTASDNVDQSTRSAFRLEEGSISGDASTKQWRRSLRASRSA